MNAVTLRPALPADALAWERLRYDLWPGDDETHGEVTSAYFAGPLNDPACVLLAETLDRTLIGFVELSIRTDLDGLLGERTAYIEGLYVHPHMRSQGVAVQLLHAAREWSRSQGCTHFASDREDRVIVDRRYSAR